MSYFNLKFRVDFLGHVKNVMINILFFTVYICNFLIAYTIRNFIERHRNVPMIFKKFYFIISQILIVHRIIISKWKIAL